MSRFQTNFLPSKQSSLLCIDRLTCGRNTTVLKWIEEWEDILELPSQRLRRTAAHTVFPGFHFALDNVGLVSHCVMLAAYSLVCIVYMFSDMC